MRFLCKWTIDRQKLAKYSIPSEDLMHDVRRSILKKIQARRGVNHLASWDSIPDDISNQLSSND